MTPAPARWEHTGVGHRVAITSGRAGTHHSESSDSAAARRANASHIRLIISLSGGTCSTVTVNGPLVTLVQPASAVIMISPIRLLASRQIVPESAVMFGD